MASWTTLKAAIAGVIKTNGNQEITGIILQNILNNIISTVGENATFAGVATPATSPGTPDGPVFYLASEVGTYSNFNGIVISFYEALCSIYWNGSSWKKEVVTYNRAILSKINALNPINNYVDNEIYNSTTGNIAVNDTCFRIEPIELLAKEGETIAWIGAKPAYTLFYSDINPDTTTHISSITSIYATIPSGAKYVAAYFRKTENPDFSSVILFQPIMHWLKYFNYIKQFVSKAEDTIPGDVLINGASYENVLRLRCGTVSNSAFINIPYAEGITYNLDGRIFTYISSIGLVSSICNYLILYKYSVNGVNGNVAQSANRKSTFFLSTKDIISVKVSDNSKYAIVQVAYYNDYKKPETYSILTVDSIKPDYNYRFMRITVKKLDNSNFTDEDTNELKVDQLSDQVDQLSGQVDQLSDQVNQLSDRVESISAQNKIEFSNDGYVNKSNSYNITDDKSGNWCNTDFIDISNATSIYAHIKGSSSTNVVLVSFYTKAIYTAIIVGSIIDSAEINGNVEIPKGAKYVRFSGATESFGGYAPIAIINISKIDNLQKEVDQLSNRVESIVENISFIDENLQNGLIDISGAESFNGDTHWNRTGYISLSGLIQIEYALKSSSSERAMFAFYSNKGDTSAISYIGMSGSTLKEGIVSEFPSNANYFRASFMTADYGNYSPVLKALKLRTKKVGDEEHVVDTLLFPRNVYVVCNDATNNSYNRNISPAIYLDHCFKTLNDKRDITFKDGGVKQTLNFETSSNSSWTPTLNGGNNINIVEKTFELSGKNAPIDNSFTVKVISTKSTPSKSKVPCILVLGSSTVYGEGSTFVSNGIQSVKPYHAICYELFKKDNIDQGEGNECILLGTVKHANLSMQYKEEQYSYDDYCEGYRGQNINGFMSMGKFTDENGIFSLKAWLNKYRTLDDNGQRLYFNASKGTTGAAGTSNMAYLENGELAKDSNGAQLYIGSLVTNTLSYNVCMPTHIVWHLGANGGATLEQIQALVSTSKNDFPNSYIALVMNDSTGTIFPDFYKDTDASKCRWNIKDSGNNRHVQNFNIQQIYDENFETDNYKLQKVYVLPFFFVSSPVFFSVRESNLPEYEYNGEDSRHLQPWGWYSATHADIRAHCNYAYQLYAWVKYTLTLEL